MSITKYHRLIPPLMSKADIPDVFFFVTPIRGDKALNQQKSMRPFAKLRGGQQVQSCAFHPSKWLDIARHWTCERMVTTTGLENLETMGIWKNHGKILNLKRHFPSSVGDFASIPSTRFRHPHQGLCQTVHRLLVQKRGQFEGYEEGGHIMAGWTGRWGKWIESNQIWCLKLIFP